MPQGKDIHNFTLLTFFAFENTGDYTELFADHYGHLPFFKKVFLDAETHQADRLRADH